MPLRSIPAVAWTVTIVVVCLTPSYWLGLGGTGDGPSWLDKTFGPLLGPLPIDKVIHFAMFFVFALAWRWAGTSGRSILIGGVALAIGTELGQAIPVLERTADLDDLIANLLGVLLALAVTRPWGVRARDAKAGPSPTS